jgi:cytochrome P450
MLLNLFPYLLAKKSLKARELLSKAFEQYFRENGHVQGSALVKARYDHSIQYNVPMTDIARFEIGGAFAILSNTSPAASWAIYHIFSDPIVLNDIRNELLSQLVENSGGRTLDISKIKVSCRILFSTFQEVLHFHSIGCAARVVMEDHLLDGKYLLKKGSTVMIPDAVQHSCASIWGDNIAAFDHRRFLNKRPHPVAFRGFGGGNALCPGRHFASAVILGFVALLVLRFDIVPVGGKWICPTTEKGEMWAMMPEPGFDIKVEIAPRKGVDLNGKWNAVFSDSDKVMELSAEDMIRK